MSEAPKPTRFQRAVMSGFRTLFLTVMFTGLGMGLGLFIGILSTAIMNISAHGGLTMALAYRRVAIPTAIVFGSCTFIYQIFSGIRTTLRPRS